MAKLRIPLPKQVEKAFKDKSKYDRKQEKNYGHEWEVDCPNCGKFIAIQKGEPVLCPKCMSATIDTTRN
jgi:hypothetical protein